MKLITLHGEMHQFNKLKRLNVIKTRYIQLYLQITYSDNFALNKINKTVQDGK